MQCAMAMQIVRAPDGQCMHLLLIYFTVWQDPPACEGLYYTIKHISCCTPKKRNTRNNRAPQKVYWQG